MMYSYYSHIIKKNNHFHQTLLIKDQCTVYRLSFDKERQLVDQKVVYAAEVFHELESAVMLLLWLVAEEREGGEDLKIEPKAGKIRNNEKKAMSASSYQR